MPYAESFDVRVENAGDPDLHLSGLVRTIPWNWDERSMHFHASWRASGPLSTRPKQVVTHARVAGRGVLVGDMLAIANPVPDWWGEGDERIAVDGASAPSHWGTGTEDLYGYGWCDTALFQAPLHGQTRCDGPGNFGRTDLYRFRALDAVPFEREARLRAGNVALGRHDRRARRVRRLLRAPGRARRRAARPARSLGVAAEAPLPARGRRGRSRDGAHRVRVSLGRRAKPRPTPARPGRAASSCSCAQRRTGTIVELEIPATPGRRAITVLATRSHDYGRMRFTVDGRPAGDLFDGRSSNGRTVEFDARIPLGEHDVGASFRLRIEVVGTSVAAEGPRRYFGLDAVVVR